MDRHKIRSFTQWFRSTALTQLALADEQTAQAKIVSPEQNAPYSAQFIPLAASGLNNQTTQTIKSRSNDATMEMSFTYDHQQGHVLCVLQAQGFVPIAQVRGHTLQLYFDNGQQFLASFDQSGRAEILLPDAHSMTWHLYNAKLT